MDYSLRPYQSECVQALITALSLKDNALCVLPTASGKSIIIHELLKRFKGSCVILINKEQLVWQLAERLSDLNATMYCAGTGSKRIGRITVATIQSIARVEVPGLDLIISDEAHNIGEGQFKTFIERHPKAKLLGFTATPWRESGPIYGHDKAPFTQIDFTRSLKFMIDGGYIVRPTCKLPPEHFDTRGLKVRMGEFVTSEVDRLTSDMNKARKQVSDAMERLAGRKKVVWVCASIEHAEMIRGLIPEESAIVHSKLANASYQLETFERGTVRHLVAVMMMTEGYDYPAIDAVVLLRPTRSSRLAVQIIGRALRPSEGKSTALVLDYGEVIKNCGPVDAPNIPSVRGTSTKAPMEISIRVCEACFSMFAKELTECPDCGWQLPEREQDKNLRTKAYEGDILSGDERVKERRELPVYKVEFYQHISKAGNPCLKVVFDVGRVYGHVAMYVSKHPFSWKKSAPLLNRLVGISLPDWQFAWDNAHQLFCDPQPSHVIVEDDGKFESVVGVEYRVRDTDVFGSA